MKINNPTEPQKANAEKKSIEEHHAILFMIGVDKYRLGKLTEEMINDILSKKDPIPKIVAETSHVLCEWMNHYWGKFNINRSESNDGIAFATVTKEKLQKKSTKQRKTCFWCKKVEHYSIECEEELLKISGGKKGTSLLIIGR